MTDLLRATVPPEHLAEFDRLCERRREIAARLPWTDDDFNELLAVGRRQVELAITAAREDAA